MRAAVVETGQACGAFSAGDSGGEDNFLADFHGGDISADLGDFAGDVAAGNVRKRDWDIGQTAADPEIEMIQGAGAYADEHFVGARFGLGDIGVLQNFGCAMLAEKDSFT